MLVMSKGALSAAQAETYYEEKYVHDDYYSEERRVVVALSFACIKARVRILAT